EAGAEGRLWRRQSETPQIGCEASAITARKIPTLQSSDRNRNDTQGCPQERKGRPDEKIGIFQTMHVAFGGKPMRACSHSPGPFRARACLPQLRRSLQGSGVS